MIVPRIRLLSSQRIDTDRLVLRAPVPDDAIEISAHLTDWEISRWLVRVPHPYCLEHATEWINRAAEERESNIGWPYLIELRNGTLSPSGRREMIGSMDLSLDRDNSAASLGYWIAKPYWAAGYAVEAASAAMEFAFETLGLRRITAGAVPENRRSIRVLEKVGFAHVDRRTEKTVERGDVEIEFFEIDRERWRANGMAAGR